MREAVGTPPGAEGPGPATELRRVLGPGLLLLFVVGDILGTGIYALTGQVAGEVGGVVWLPFLVAFAVAIVTAFSYLELVTKYPRAAGAALYTHKAFGIHFLTFMVAFTVMCSGVTSAATASRAFAANVGEALEVTLDGGAAITLVALGFMALVGAVNLRGVGESVRANVLLTCVELSGLLLVIGAGAWALLGGEGDLSRTTELDTGGHATAFGAVTAGAALAFFAMVGFEDSVNMAEETKDPVRIFPRVMLTGLCLTALVYVLVSLAAIALVAPADLSRGDTFLL
jgi:APA family basic amino acid/polyamine antiporter